MKREGRQHGLVIFHERYAESCRGKYRILNKLETVPTTKFMTKVPSKPTNHSRFTSRCHRPRCYGCNDWGCHNYPINKSRIKAKGNHKHNYQHDVAVNHLLVSHRLVGSGHGDRWIRFDSGSVKYILDQLNGTYYEHVNDSYDEYSDDYDMAWHDKNVKQEVGEEHCCLVTELEKETQEVEDDTGFCFVDFVTEMGGNDDWCLIGEI